MAKNTFTMRVQKKGRSKYLTLTIAPAILLLYFLTRLLSAGFFPFIEYAGLVSTIISMSFMMLLAYFFIFRKNHTIEIQDNKIIETSFSGKEYCRIKTEQISSIRRNFLNEIVLVDKSGKRLLCVEPNMTNFDLFEQWLIRHNIQ